MKIIALQSMLTPLPNHSRLVDPGPLFFPQRMSYLTLIPQRLTRGCCIGFVMGNNGILSFEYFPVSTSDCPRYELIHPFIVTILSFTLFSSKRSQI